MYYLTNLRFWADRFDANFTKSDVAFAPSLSTICARLYSHLFYRLRHLSPCGSPGINDTIEGVWYKSVFAQKGLYNALFSFFTTLSAEHYDTFRICFSLCKFFLCIESWFCSQCPPVYFQWNISSQCCGIYFILSWISPYPTQTLSHSVFLYYGFLLS